MARAVSMTAVSAVFALMALMMACAVAEDVCTEGLYMPDGAAYFELGALVAPTTEGYTVTYIDDDSTYNYAFDICGSVPCKPGGSDEAVSACQSYGSKHKVLGLADTATYDFDVEGGPIGFTITTTGGDVCHHNQQERSTIINVVCDPAVTTPTASFLAEEECVYSFELRSADACPHQVVKPEFKAPRECSSQGKTFTDSAGNDYTYYPGHLMSFKPYEADVEEYDYRVNLCAPVDCTFSTDHESHFGACQTTESDGEPKSYGLGQSIDSQVTITQLSPNVGPINGGFNYVMTGGQPCHRGSESGQTTERETVVTVLCDDSLEEGETRFSFIGETSHCVYEFLLESAAACPETSNTPAPPHAEACPDKVMSEDGSFFYSPAALAGTDFTTTVDVDVEYLYTVSVCGATTACTTSDGKDAAACQARQDSQPKVHSLGLANQVSVRPLLPERTGFRVHYYGGDICHHTKSPRETIINVICSPRDTPELQFIQEDENCVYTFNLLTSLGCPTDAVIPDVVHCGEQLPAVDGTGYFPYAELTAALKEPYQAHDEDSDNDSVYDYTFNICGAVECEGAHLGPDAHYAACQSVEHPSSGKTGAYALGVVDTAEITAHDDNKGYTVVYTGGDLCSNEDVRTTLIHVECKEDEVTPKVTFEGETAHCQYEFKIKASKGACLVPTSDASPGSGGMSGGGIFFIILIVILILAVAGAVAYQVLYKGGQSEPGADPQWSFAAAGEGSIWGKIKGMFSGGASEYQFERLATDDPDLEGGL